MTDQGCNKFSAERFLRDACNGAVPGQLLTLFQYLKTPSGQDFFCLANAIGALEPLSFTRPGAGELVQVYDKVVTVPPATFGPGTPEFPNGPIVPSERKLISICAPISKALVIQYLRGKGEDLTALQDGNLIFKRLAVIGFSEGFCPAGEPGAGDDQGTFNNIEHILLPGGAGFDVYAQNWNPYSPATFSLHARMWETC